MTTAEMLASLEAQIRKDIPRLMELREGCYLKHNIVSSIYKIYCVDHYNYHLFRPSDKEIWILSKELLEKSLLKKEMFEIIGHDIMLNDVLEWLNHIIYEKCIPINDLGYSGMVKQFYVKGDDGSIIFEILDLKNPDLGLDTIRYGVWNLSSIYLKDQSEELIKFLYNIKINKVMETLNNIFVPYKIAVQLKQIRFDEPCMAFVEKDIEFKIHTTVTERLSTVYLKEIKSIDYNAEEKVLSLPTWEQVFDWFREKGIDSSLFTEDGRYYYRGSKGNKFLFSGTEDTYKQAREALILKLIEIYKNEQDI